MTARWDRVPVASVWVGLYLVGALAGCGSCPRFPTRGNLSADQLNWVRRTQAAAGRGNTEPGTLALEFKFIPFVIAGGHSVTVQEPSLGGGVGPVSFREVYFHGAPFPIWAMRYSDTWYDLEGHNLGHAEHHQALWLPAPLFSWGSFGYEKEVPKQLFPSCFFPPLLPGLLPARWFFDGKEGHYWHALWGLFGHITTTESSTFVIWFVPIKHGRSAVKNVEP